MTTSDHLWSHARNDNKTTADNLMVLYTSRHRSARLVWNNFKLPRKRRPTLRMLTTAQTRLVVRDDAELWKRNKANQMAWPSAQLWEMRDDMELGKRLHGNVGEDNKLENAAIARSTHRRQTNITLTRRASIFDSPLSLVTDSTVRDD